MLAKRPRSDTQQTFLFLVFLTILSLPYPVKNLETFKNPQFFKSFKKRKSLNFTFTFGICIIFSITAIIGLKITILRTGSQQKLSTNALSQQNNSCAGSVVESKQQLQLLTFFLRLVVFSTLKGALHAQSCPNDCEIIMLLYDSFLNHYHL